MQVKLYSLVLLTSTLLTVLTNQSSSAFSLYYTPKPEDYFAVSNFQFSNAQGITTLDVVDPDLVVLSPFGLYPSQPYIHEIKRGGTDGLLADLQIYRDDGWTFNKGRDLRGSFNVGRLYACGIDKNCGTTKIGGANGISDIGIGATLELEYRPSSNRKSGDPTPAKNRLQWIQRVITNYPPGLPGVHQSYIDNRNQRGENALHPYYGGGANPTPIQPQPSSGYGYFGDRPYRINNFNRDYYWIAELYLAEADKSNPLNVTIYNGVRWGWVYRYIPNNDDSCLVSSTGGACPPPPPPPPPCNGYSGGGGCDRNAVTDYTDYQELSALDINNANENEPQYQYLSFLNFNEISSSEEEEHKDSESPVSTPESTSALGLLALSAWGIIKAMKIRIEK